MPDTAVAPPPRTGGGSGGSGIGQMLRDPDHYEEINVIGNGKLNFGSTLLVKILPNYNIDFCSKRQIQFQKVKMKYFS